ncbi:hypothetical protein KAU88_07685 [Candidatus Bathyarchaeota archaeon]|nr:hypothetical protein [Candidatus Bathyarchaeota archaeon]
MKKMLSAALLTCIVAFLTLSTPVHATPPTTVSGTVNYTFSVEEMREADGNLFLYAIEWEDWMGDFEGTAEAFFRVEVFSSAGFWNVWLRSTFTGIVNGESGTLVIQLVGKKPLGEDWYGQWVIINGEGGLADLRGQGTWGGPGWRSDIKIPGDPDLWYEGQIHFD